MVPMEIIFIIFLVMINGVFAMAEIALVSSRASRLQQMAQRGSKGARIAYELKQNPGNFLSAVQIGITLVGIVAGVIGELSLRDDVSSFLSQVPIIGQWHTQISFIVVVAVITYVSMVVGELTPKRIALSRPEHIASFIAPLMKTISVVMFPVVRFLSISMDGLFSLIHLRPISDLPVTEEEVKSLIREGTKIGIFHKSEKEIVDRVLRLDDLYVGNIMTPRVQIQWFDQHGLISHLQNLNGADYHSRILVCDKGLDGILGYIPIKELLHLHIVGKGGDYKNHLRQPLFIPENTKALKLLGVFRKSPIDMALIIDEFGNVQGLVTLSDILQALVGEIKSLADDQEDPDVVKRQDGSYLVDGIMSINEAKELFKVSEFPKENTGRFQTLGGFILTYLDRIPKVGESLEAAGWRFEIVDMDQHRIDKVLVKKVRQSNASTTHFRG